MSKPILHRVPETLLARVDAWASTHGEVNRTVAFNLLIAAALDTNDRADLVAENEGLRAMVVKLATAHAERPPLVIPFTPNDPEFSPVGMSNPRGGFTQAAPYIKRALNSAYGLPPSGAPDKPERL